MNGINGITNNNFLSFAKSKINSTKAVEKFDYQPHQINQTNEPVGQDESIYNNYMHLKNSNLTGNKLPRVEEGNKTEKIYCSHHYNGYLKRTAGEFVFDLSEIQNKFTNKIAFPEVEVYNDEVNTVFRAYFEKPNSNELIRVDISVPQHEYVVPMDQEKFMNSIGKALMLVDKNISIRQQLRDVIPSYMGGGFDYDPTTNTIDLTYHINAMKERIHMRMTGQLPLGIDGINYGVSQNVLNSILKELDDFILGLGL